jgi:protein SCO1/2
MKEFATFFHPRLVALTGTNDQVAEAAKAYRVYYAKAEEEGSDPDTYLMDHTAFTYLMGPDGHFLQHFSHNTSADAMADRLRKILGGTSG